MKKVYFIILLFFPLFASAQSARSFINDGVDLYKKDKYSDSEINFKKGLDKKYDSFEGHFNLGDAYYKQQRYDQALKSYQNALALAKDDYRKSKVFHNMGNALLKGKKIKEAIGAYKNALKLDPNDLDTKYNLSYALNMLKNRKKQNKNQNKNDKNKKNKDKNKQNKNNQDKNKRNRNKQDQQKNQQNQKQNRQKEQKKRSQEQKMSKAEAARILNALKNNEAELQKKLRKKKGKVVKKEKDW